MVSTTKQEGTRLDLLSALWEGLLDIVCSVVGAAMAVTLWKVPMLLKILRINGHMSEAQTETLSELDRIKLLRVKGKTFMSIHQCVLFCFFSWALDLPTVPLGLAVSIVFPWRASTVFSLVIKPDDRLPTKFSLEKLLLNRRLYTIFIILAMFISDLTCIFCGALLFLSVWHVGELYTILVKKKPGKKREDGVSVSDYFEMNRQIYKKFMFLLVDVLQVAQIVFIICTGVQAPSLVRRLKTLWRNERAEQRVLRIRKFPEGDKKPQKQFVSMPYNVMTTILSFCDVPDVLRAEGTCRKVCEAASAPRVWTKLHETKYAKFAPIPSGTEDPDYRRFCVAGYKEMRERAKRSEEPIISEEERDRIIGARVIICEESVYAILRLPHILCLPVKALAFILHPTRTPLLALIQKLSENPEFHTYSLYDVINGPHPDYFLERDAGELRDFWRVQDTLLGTVAIYYIAFSLTVATLAAKINFSIMKATTEWITHPIIVNSYWNQIAYGGQLPAMTRPFFNGTMQVLTFPVVLALCFGPFILPFWLCYHYLGYDVLASIGGPYLLNVFPFGTGIQIIITTCDLLRSATHYNPIKAIFEGASVVGRTGRDGITRVVSFLFRLIKGAFVTFIRNLRQA